MSVVIAIKKDGVVYMAADTMITYGDSKRHLNSNTSQKIWAVNDTENCIMGGTGYFRDINLIRYCTSNLVPEANLIKEELDVGVIMMNTVPVIFKTIRNYSNLIDGEGSNIPFESSFLYAYKDHLFSIMPDGLVEEIEDYVAIGSGANAALASLKHTVDEPVCDRLIKALEAASDISLYVAEPYVYIDTETIELYDLIKYETDDLDDADAQDLFVENENENSENNETKLDK